MLQHELNNLQEIARRLELPGSGGQRDQLRPNIDSECARFCQALTKAIFSSAKDNVIERYIQFHQAGITALADQAHLSLTQIRLSGTAYPADQESHLTNQLKQFISKLLDVLGYMARYFPKYYDKAVAVPLSRRELAFKGMEDQIRLIVILAEARLNSPLLRDCLSSFLGLVLENGFPTGTSVVHLNYLKEFTDGLMEVFRTKEGPERDFDVSVKLIQLNYNHLAFFAACQKMIEIELEHAANIPTGLEILAKYQALFKNIHYKPGLIYHPDWPDIKTMLTGWIGDEITILSIISKENSATCKSADEDKLDFSLSVAHLACLTRMLYEEHSFSNLSVTEVLKFMSRHYRSKRQLHISPGSLSKEYYGVSQVTAAVVRDLLQRMVTRIEKTYFP